MHTQVIKESPGFFLVLNVVSLLQSESSDLCSYMWCLWLSQHHLLKSPSTPGAGGHHWSCVDFAGVLSSVPVPLSCPRLSRRHGGVFVLVHTASPLIFSGISRLFLCFELEYQLTLPRKKSLLVFYGDCIKYKLTLQQTYLSSGVILFKKRGMFPLVPVVPSDRTSSE